MESISDSTPFEGYPEESLGGLVKDCKFAILEKCSSQELVVLARTNGLFRRIILSSPKFLAPLYVGYAHIWNQRDKSSDPKEYTIVINAIEEEEGSLERIDRHLQQTARSYPRLIFRDYLWNISPQIRDSLREYAKEKPSPVENIEEFKSSPKGLKDGRILSSLIQMACAFYSIS